MKKVFFRILMFILVIITAMGLGSNLKISYAADAPSTAQVFKNAPKGVKLGDFISAPEYYKNTVTGYEYDFQSSNTLIKAGDSNNEYENTSDIIQMINGSGVNGYPLKPIQIGSFWGKIKEDPDTKENKFNYFDLNKHQEVSAWIYNGDESNTGIDGFAFVLQNDTNGDQAIARNNGQPVGGESLGIWSGGITNSSGIKTPITQNDLVNNSLAIEFDMFANKSDSSKNDYLDYDVFNSNDLTSDLDANVVQNQTKARHTSWNYPGVMSNYVQKNYGFMGGGPYSYHMKHQRKVTSDIPMAGYDGNEATYPNSPNPKDAWRHFVAIYDPPAEGSKTGKLQYIFNDKYQDGTKRFTSDGGTINVDISRFNSKDGKIRWGFTAAVGSPQATPKDFAIVMERMPAIVDIDQKSTLYDMTRETDSDTSTGSLATGDGDDLKLKYNLEYKDGISESTDIKTTIGLPEHVDYSGDENGKIGLITFIDKDGNKKTQEINKTELKEITVTVPGKTVLDPPTYKQLTGLELTVPSMKEVGEKAQIEIYGKAKAPDSDTLTTTKVGSEHTSFDSDNYTGDVMSPEFTIDNEKLQITNTNDLNQELQNDESARFTGKINYLRNTKFDGKNLTAKIVVYDKDGKSINADGIGDVPVTSGVSEGKFDLSYPLDDLKSGETYTFKVSLSDSSGRVSNTLVYTVNISDTRQLILTKSNYLDYTVTERASMSPLGGMLKYDDNSSIVSTNLKLYVQVDDGPVVESIVNSIYTGTELTVGFDTPKNIELGVRTIKAYVTDGNNVSNTIVYKLKFIEHGLTLAPDKKELTVSSNDPVTLKWNVGYSSENDNIAEGAIPKSIKKNTLQIKNEGDSEFRNFYFLGNDAEEDITNVVKQDEDGSFDFKVNPIEYNNYKFLNQLKEGRNEIRLSIKGSGGFTSSVATVIVNVPKLTPVLTIQKELYAKTSKSNVKFPVEFSYKEDPNYSASTKQVPIKLQTDEGNLIDLGVVGGGDASGAPLSFVGMAFLDGLKLTEEKTPVYYSTRDPYGRETGWSGPMIIDISGKYLALDVNDYSFRDISYKDRLGDHIQRQGHWAVNVDSLGYKWKLKAKSNGLFNKENAAFSEPLIYIDKDDDEFSLQNNPVIATRDTPITGQNATEDITTNWDDDDGILLKNSQPSIAGEYQGEIGWTLTESI